MTLRRLCLWCRGVVVFRAGHGWVHEATGETVVTYVQDGQTRDDHVAAPDNSGGDAR